MDEVKIWALDGDSNVVPLASKGQTDTDSLLEETLVRNPDLLIPGLRLVGRQTPTDGGPLDLLGVDEDGRLIVFELKRRYAVTGRRCADYRLLLRPGHRDRRRIGRAHRRQLRRGWHRAHRGLRGVVRREHRRPEPRIPQAATPGPDRLGGRRQDGADGEVPRREYPHGHLVADLPRLYVRRLRGTEGLGHAGGLGGSGGVII